MEIKISIGAGRAVGMSPITEGIRFPGERGLRPPLHEISGLKPSILKGHPQGGY